MNIKRNTATNMNCVKTNQYCINLNNLNFYRYK